MVNSRPLPQVASVIDTDAAVQLDPGALVRPRRNAVALVLEELRNAFLILHSLILAAVLEVLAQNGLDHGQGRDENDSGNELHDCEFSSVLLGRQVRSEVR